MMAESRSTTNRTKSNSKSRSSSKKKTTGNAKAAVFSTALELATGERSELIGMLQQHMADTHELYDQTKVAHWNVKGENFWALHKLFDELAEMIHPFIDSMAERITLLGGFARGTSSQTAAATNIEEFPEGPQDGETYLRELQARYAQLADDSRKHAEAAAEDDPTTEDLFIEVSRTADQALYFIEAHLHDPKKS